MVLGGLQFGSCLRGPAIRAKNFVSFVPVMVKYAHA